MAEPGAAAWRVEAVEDPAEVTRRAGAWLVAHAVDANVIGSVVAGSLAQPPGERIPALWLLVLGEDAEVAGVAMQRDPFAIFLPDLPPGAPEAVAVELVRRGRTTPGADGDADAAWAFAVAWYGLTGARWSQIAAARLYVLDALLPPAGVPGALRPATGADVEHCAAWAEAFVAETHVPAAPGGQRDVVRRRIAAGEISLWEVDGEPVAMAAASPMVGGVARVNLVYTPPAGRGRGYGAAVSAAVTRRALESGADTCMLYADVDNPRSNAVYRRIGYRPYADSITYRFSSPAAAAPAQSHSTSPEARS